MPTIAYQPLAAPQPNVVAAALPAVLPQVILAALAAGEELAAAARAREEADRLRTQADQAAQVAANQAAIALVAAEHAAAEAHRYADVLDQSKAERAVESAIADSTLGRVQTATLDIAQAAAAREEAPAAFNGIDAVPEATAQQALTGGQDEVSWSRLAPPISPSRKTRPMMLSLMPWLPLQKPRPTTPRWVRSLLPATHLRTLLRKHVRSPPR